MLIYLFSILQYKDDKKIVTLYYNILLFLYYGAIKGVIGEKIDYF